MSDNVEKHIEKLANKMIEESKLESPSLDFTATVMSQIETSAQNKITTYKPLISKQFWIGVFICVAAFFGFAFFESTPETTSWFSSISFNVLSNNKVTHVLSNITISKTVVYAIVFFGAMFLIQIPLLKHYFDKRLEV